MTLLVLLVAGAVGASCRYGLTVEVSERWPTAFPIATLAVNVVASFLLGLLVGAVDAGALGGDWRTVLGLGFLGAFSTLSTFAVETVYLVERREWRVGLRYVAGSVVLACLAAAAGLVAWGAF